MGISRRARFKYIGIGTDSMGRIGNATRDSVEARILRAENVSDAPAKPLSVRGGEKRSYRGQKMRRGGKPVRDWKLTGHTLSQMRVMFSSATQAVIGFLSGIGPGRKIPAPKIAAIRNADERQFGMSDRNRSDMHNAIVTELAARPYVTTERIP